MNKNIVIGVLIVVVLIGLGYYVFKSNGVVTPTTDTSVNVPSTEQPVSKGNPTLIPDVPVVQTSSSNSTSNSTAALTGTVKPNGLSTTYWFEYGLSTALGNQGTTQAIGSGYSSLQAPGFIAGLQANTLYYYRLSARNSSGTVNGAMYTFQTNSNPPPIVRATTVRTAVATNISRSTAIINGQVNPNGFATSYWYEYGTDTNFGLVTSFLATNSGTSFMSVPTLISGLEPLTKYYFRLNAENQFGTVNGSILNFTTTGPVAPSKPTVQTSKAIKISSTEATLVGQINPNGADTVYWFEYGTDSILSNLIGSGTPKKTVVGTNLQVVQTNVNGLQANTKYYYHLVGTNSNGTVNGNIISFTTKNN